MSDKYSITSDINYVVLITALPRYSTSLRLSRRNDSGSNTSTATMLLSGEPMAQECDASKTQCTHCCPAPGKSTRHNLYINRNNFNVRKVGMRFIHFDRTGKRYGISFLITGLNCGNTFSRIILFSSADTLLKSIVFLNSLILIKPVASRTALPKINSVAIVLTKVVVSSRRVTTISSSFTTATIPFLTRKYRRLPMPNACSNCQRLCWHPLKA